MKTMKRTIHEKICPLEFAVKAISGKWKIPIVWQMNEGKKRPSELLRNIIDVDRRVLNQQLKELEQDGIIKKNIFKEVPPRVEYTLTDKGQKLVKILWELNEWGKLLIDT